MKVLVLAIIFPNILAANSDTVTVNSLEDLKEAVKLSDQNIVMTAGNYNLEDDLPSSSRNITCSGSNNTIDLTGLYVKVPVGSFHAAYILVSGDNNTIIGGEFEDTYSSGITEVTDFSAYNQDRTNLSNGLGSANMIISGVDNLIIGLKLTIRGSFPYGYGSMYGINQDNVFGTDKHSGLLINGKGNTLDSVEVQQRAFGHGIFMQGEADEIVIKNSLVEGRVRAYAELYEETESWDLPYRSDYKMPLDGNVPIPTDEVFSLSEDGIRMYTGTGSVTVENCTVKKMRGGFRLYLGGTCKVSNSMAIDCGSTNYNLSKNGTIINSSGNFAYAPLSDNRLSRGNQNIELTIIPSPHATGPHNLYDVLGSGHDIVFHRTPGPLDPILYPIVVTGDNSTITNETEYPIILESTASGNTIVSCGAVIDNGSGNNVTQTNCSFGASTTIEAEDYTAMLGVEITPTTDEGEGDKISSIDANDWMDYEITIPLAGSYSFDYRVSGVSNGDFKVELNGEVIDELTFNATGSDEVWETIRSSSPINLNAGVDTIRIISDVAGWNLNWISLTAECYKSEIIPRIKIIDFQGTESGLLEQSEATLLPGFSVDLSPLPDLGGSWSWTGPNDFTSDDRVVSLSDIQKKQSGDYIAVYTNDCGVESKATFTINVQDSLYIEAEDYSLMHAVTVEATSDISGDSSVTSIVSGSWMEYEVEVPFSALYSFSYRVASENAASFDLSINSESIDDIAFNSTGGAQSWTSVNSDTSEYLKAGMQTLRISSKSEDWNINWLQLNVLESVRECLLPYTSDGFTVRRDSIVWSSGVFDISCETDVDIHMVLEGIGTFGESDYFRAYYKLDNGDMVLITEKVDALNETMISTKALVGTTVELIIQSQTVESTARFILSNIMVLKGSDPLAKIEAEDYDDAYGTKTETCRDTGGGENVGSINSENWLKFSNINLSEVHSVNMRLASTLSGGTVEVRLGSETGDIIGSLEMPNTGNWQTWETVTASLESVVGFYDVYIVFKSSEKYVGNINWLEFSDEKIGGASVDKVGDVKDISFYPNPIKDKLTITDSNGAYIQIYNQLGTMVRKADVESDLHVISMADLQSGFYVIRVSNKGSVKSYSVIKE